MKTALDLSHMRVFSRTMSLPMKNRIRERLAKLNLSPRAASLRVSTNADLFRGVLRAGSDANPTVDTVAKIARALDVSPEWLLGATESESPTETLAGEVRPAVVRLPDQHEMAKDLPVWGTAQGSIVDSQFEGFSLHSGDPVEFVRRPPALARVRNAYAIYVSGDSMAPMHAPGELRFVNPNRPAAPGDTVIVQTKSHDDDPGQGYIKILRRQRPDTVELEQINPLAKISVEMKFVVNIHRVLTMNELFGY
jgi:phage repressor protein C with HTH and peptisase S24 domain